MTSLPPGQAPRSSLLARYAADTACPAAGAGLVALAVLGLNLWAELAAGFLPADGSGGWRLASLGIARLDDAQPRSLINPHLDLTWTLAAVLLLLVFLPLGARIGGGYGRALLVAIGLIYGGSTANLIVVALEGRVHNWAAVFGADGRILVDFSLADLAVLAGISLTIGLTLAGLGGAAIEWLSGRRTADQKGDPES